MGAPKYNTELMRKSQFVISDAEYERQYNPDRNEGEAIYEGVPTHEQIKNSVYSALDVFAIAYKDKIETILSKYSDPPRPEDITIIYSELETTLIGLSRQIRTKDIYEMTEKIKDGLGYSAPKRAAAKS